MIRVRYVSNDLSEGVVENLRGDYFHVYDDDRVELREHRPNNKYKVVGNIRADRWESIYIVDETAEVEERGYED